LSTHRRLLGGDSPVGVGTYPIFFPLHRLRTSRISGEDAFRSFTEGQELRLASSLKLGLSPLPSCYLSGSERLGLSAFPPLQTGQAPFNASGFPVRSPYYSAAGWRLVRSSQGAPVIVPTDHRHLLSRVHLLNRCPKTSAFQSFTLSRLLQPGLWLLRCLRPLFRTLACLSSLDE
jgi:hypothetical protein